MICPSCGFEVEEGLLSCPYCDADLTATSPLRAAGAQWCSSCGALLEAHDALCPRCGAPCDNAAHTPSSDSQSEAHLSSALPSQAEVEQSLQKTRAPLTRYVIAVIAGITVLAILGFALSQFFSQDEGAEQPGEVATSAQNEPQRINALSGQDFRTSDITQLGAQGSRTTQEWAQDAYDIMCGLAARLKVNWALIDQVSEGTLTQGFDAGRDEAQAICSAVDTLYQDIAGAPEDEEYLVEVGQIMKLVEWLRTSSKGVLSAWDAAMTTDGTTRAEAIVEALETSGANAASDEFVQHYQAWEPTG